MFFLQVLTRGQYWHIPLAGVYNSYPTEDSTDRKTSGWRHSLLAQMFGDIGAPEALEVIEPSGQTSSRFVVASAAIVKNICVFKTFHTIHVWVPVRQRVLQLCITAAQHTNTLNTDHPTTDWSVWLSRPFLLFSFDICSSRLGMLCSSCQCTFSENLYFLYQHKMSIAPDFYYIVMHYQVKLRFIF